jgi:hypothetical protein
VFNYMAVNNENRAVKAQTELADKLQQLPREGVDRWQVEALVPLVAGKGSENKAKKGRSLVKEAQEKETSRVRKLRPGTQVDRTDVEPL